MILDQTTQHDILNLTRMALSEDIGSNDLESARDCTTLAMVPDDVTASAAFVSRTTGVVCGLQVIRLIVAHFAPNLSLRLALDDGDQVAPRQEIASLMGEARKILMIERTCLNFLCRLSGISTLTAQFVQRTRGTNAKIFDTRKTTPGWRRIEKYAVACGGGHNHRMGLYDAIMIKDNHLAMYGNHIDDHKLSVSQAIDLAREWVLENQVTLPNGRDTIIQIEVDTLEQLQIALKSNPDIVLLDNMSTQLLCQAVEMRNVHNRQVLLEASGGVNLQTVAAIAKTGVDRISVGAITHSATNFDIGLDWQRL